MEILNSGLYATKNYSVGDTVWEYKSNPSVFKLSSTEIDNLAKTDYDCFTRYCWQNDEDEWEGTIGDPKCDEVNFLDHSCDPNLHFLNDDTLIARYDIKKGDKLTIDYAMCDTRFAEFDDPCYCGSAKCRKFIKNTDAYNLNIIGEYLPNVRSFLLRYHVL